MIYFAGDHSGTLSEETRRDGHGGFLLFAGDQRKRMPQGSAQLYFVTPSANSQREGQVV